MENKTIQRLGGLPGSYTQVIVDKEIGNTFD